MCQQLKMKLGSPGEFDILLAVMYIKSIPSVLMDRLGRDVDSTEYRILR